MKITLATTLILSLTAAFLQAQAVPGLVSYQGKVVDGSGIGLGTGTPVNRKILFRLFDSGTAGDRLWSEEQTVTLSNGDFSVILGQGIAASYNGSPENPRPSLLTVFSGTDRYLEIVVDNGDGAFNATDTPITPRQRLVSTAFAIRASVADGIASGTDFNLRDTNHGLGWYGTDRLFNDINPDGPVLYGFNGGALGSVNGTAQNVALRWNSAGNVGIGTATPSERLDVLGNAKISGNLAVSGTGTFNNGGGTAAPTVNSGGAGMRLKFWEGTATDPPFGMGIDTSTLFSVVPSSAFHRWYGGTTQRMSLNGSNGNLSVTGNVSAPSVTASGSVSAASVAVTGNVSAGSLTSAGGLSFGGFGANSTEGGSTGNFISFATSGFSEDFLGYAANTFYMKDSPGGGDTQQPDLVVGGTVHANRVVANGKTAAVGEEEIRIIRGNVRGVTNNVTVLQGTGFTTRKARNADQSINDSVYEVIFTTPFGGVPSITANYVRFGQGWDSARQFVTIYDPSATGFKFIPTGDGGGYFPTLDFGFIALGPR